MLWLLVAFANVLTLKKKESSPVALVGVLFAMGLVALAYWPALVWFGRQKSKQE